MKDDGFVKNPISCISKYLLSHPITFYECIKDKYSTPDNNNRPSTTYFVLSRLILLFFISLVIYPSLSPVRAEQNSTNTIVLPLKINSESTVEQLTIEADGALHNAATKQGFSMLSRSQAEESLKYDGAWPPPADDINKIIPQGTDYAVTGSLTNTGASLSIDMVVLDLLDASQTKYYFEEGKSFEDLPEIFNRLARKIILFTNRYSRISQITIAGNKKIDSGAILQKVKLQSGDSLDPVKIRQAIKDIYKMGYFENINIQKEETEEGLSIIFEVTEKAVIGQIILSGEEEIETDEVRDVIELTPNSIINTKDIQSSIEGVKELYKGQGFYNTKVSTELVTTKTGKIDVHFKIKEGKKVYIKDLTFSGNKAFKGKKLKKILQTTERSWLSWITDTGVLNHDIVEQDASRLAAFYHNHGYIEAKVGAPVITQKGEWIDVKFEIFEGDRYRVGIVDLAGELIEDKTSLLKMLESNKEEYFSRKTLREDVLKITDRYAEKGYAFAEAHPSTDKDPLNKRINVKISIEKKELVYINRIVIKGNERTRDKIIRREMRVKETGIFNAAALKKSHNRLQRLDYFETVEVVPEPTLDESLMDIVVNVKEKATGNFSIGAGYSSVDSIMFMGEISENNFLGKGQRLSLQANLSGTSNQYNLSFTEPHLADSKLLFGFNLYDWSKDYDDYDKDSHGFGLRFGYPVWKRWYMSSGYSYDDSTLDNIGDNASQIILDSADIHVTSALTLGFSRDSRNKATGTSKGAVHSIKTKYAGGFLGGDSDFTKVEASTSWFFELPWTTVLHTKLAAGIAFANSGNKLPVYEKFYLGGINTIRGFKTANISPRDPVTDEKIGGGKMWYYNLEWLFPLVKDAGLRGLVFFDAGNVYSEHSNWDFGEIKKSAGFGFRWLSPMGPLRLEYGYNLDPKEFEDQGNWDFNIGGSF